MTLAQLFKTLHYRFGNQRILSILTVAAARWPVLLKNEDFVSAWTSHASGACRDQEGNLHKLMF
jgi:hypothetical protein